MNTAQRILILTGLALIAGTMAYGVGYALFDEHQTLVGMGTQLAMGFTEASRGNLDAAYSALNTYGELTQEYRYEVHSHGHWGMLSLVLIILGLTFNRLPLQERQAVLLAMLLATSATLFPLGVLLQIGPYAGLGKLLSVTGSIGLIAGLLTVVYNMMKSPPG